MKRRWPTQWFRRPMARLRQLLVLVAVLAITGCASPVPRPVRQPAPGDPGVAVVRAAPETAYEGQAIRWGGRIIKTDNHVGQTRIIVLARTLDSDGRPTENSGGGRFIATVKGFLDPALFRPGRLLTVVGHVTGMQTHPVGSFNYRYPVVRVDTYYLWPPLPHYSRWSDQPPYWDPYWYDPWYPFRGPGWPYTPYW